MEYELRMNDCLYEFRNDFKLLVWREPDDRTNIKRAGRPDQSINYNILWDIF